MTRAAQAAASWRARWTRLAAREQRLIAGAALVVGLALLWWVALAPALRTLSNAPAEHAKLDAQLQRMTALQTQARALQSQPRANRADALRALEASLRQELGTQAQMQAAGAGEGAALALRGAPAGALAQWLGQARGNARAIPREAHLTRARPTAEDGAGEVRWDGTLVMGLPAP